MTAAPLSLPSGIRLLTDAEVERLDAMHSGFKGSTACPTCDGKKTYEWPEGTVNDCDCNSQRILHRYFTYCGIGMRYQRLGWLDVTHVDPVARDKVFDYADHAGAYIHTGLGLNLYGKDMGTGKTMLATLLLKQLLSAGIDGYFTQFNELLDSHTATWGNNPEERAWFAKRIRNTGVLVIDDVGRENVGRLNVAEAMFDTVIRARHDACKPTIITTNKTPEEFESLYRSNIMSLLSGVCRLVPVAGSDYRPIESDKTLEETRKGLRRPIVVG